MTLALNLPTTRYNVYISQILTRSIGAKTSTSRLKIPRSLTIIRSSPRYNPQNVDEPQAIPSPTSSAEEAVSAQLEALSNNNHPWANHGLQVAYEYGYDIGGLDPSYYFGFRKDLYHQDHFMQAFQTNLPELMNNSSYTIESSSESVTSEGEEEWTVVCSVVSGTGKENGRFAFRLRRKKVGARKGALMTWSICRVVQTVIC